MSAGNPGDLRTRGPSRSPERRQPTTVVAADDHVLGSATVLRNEGLSSDFAEMTDYENVEKLLAKTPTAGNAPEFNWNKPPLKSGSRASAASLSKLIINGQPGDNKDSSASLFSTMTPAASKKESDVRITRILILLTAALGIVLACLLVAFGAHALNRPTNPPTAPPDMASIADANRAKLSTTPGATTYPTCPTCVVPNELPKDFDGSYTVGEDPREDDRDEDDHDKLEPSKAEEKKKGGH